MGTQLNRARLLDEFKRAEAILREREAVYLECAHVYSPGPQCVQAYKAVLAARKESDAAYEKYLASDPDHIQVMANTSLTNRHYSQR